MRRRQGHGEGAGLSRLVEETFIATRARALVRCMRTAVAHLGLDDGRAFALVGTVPAQHMYGFEVTVLLALQGGLAFSNRQPFYPADIREALEAVPQPRPSPPHARLLWCRSWSIPAASQSASQPGGHTSMLQNMQRWG